jgi:glycosyltransferase involved in cell wall biosynthesis
MNVLTVLACAGRPFPVIISERCDPGAQSIGATWGLLRRLVYPRADAVVVQTRSIKEFFPEKIRVRSHIIPNPVIAPKQLRDSRVRKKRKIIGMGRLVEQKDLIFSSGLFENFGRSPDWFLEIWGQGPLRQELEQLAQALHLANRVSFQARRRIRMPFCWKPTYLCCLRGMKVFLMCCPKPWRAVCR